MFSYTNTLVLNTNLDSSGKPKWTSQDENKNAGVKASFNVKRVNKFIKDNVVAIYKTEGYNPVYSSANLKVENDGEGMYRIAIYMRYSGNTHPFYANDLAFYGKPMWIEYKVGKGDLPADIAKRIVKNAGLYNQIMDNKIFSITANADNLTIKAFDEYLRFVKVDIERYGPLDHACGCDTDCMCGFSVIKSAKEANDPEWDQENTLILGAEGFGTYTHIMKDFRLPTMEARQWGAMNEEELPIPGTLYNQYTLHYCKNRGILGGEAVGQETHSITTHVFYVAQGIADDFEEGLAKVGTIEKVNKIGGSGFNVKPQAPQNFSGKPNSPKGQKKNGTKDEILVGKGIVSTYSKTANDGELELFLIPQEAGKEALRPVGPQYTAQTSNPIQDISVAFGATKLSDKDWDIVEEYDIRLVVGAGSTSINNPNETTLTFKKIGIQSDSNPLYIITDSYVDANNIQNATRVKYLCGNNMLNEDAVKDGPVWYFILRATHRGTGKSFQVVAYIMNTPPSVEPSENQ